jgi:hypothetical protein
MRLTFCAIDKKLTFATPLVLMSARPTGGVEVCPRQEGRDVTVDPRAERRSTYRSSPLHPSGMDGRAAAAGAGQDEDDGGAESREQALLSRVRAEYQRKLQREAAEDASERRSLSSPMTEAEAEAAVRRAADCALVCTHPSAQPDCSSRTAYATAAVAGPPTLRLQG